MKDPICKNLIEEELASIKDKVAKYSDNLGGLKKDRGLAREGRNFITQKQYIEDEIEVLKSRMNYLREDSRARLSAGIDNVFSEVGPGVEIEGEAINLDQNIFSIMLESNLGEVEIKVGDKYTGAIEGNNFAHRVLGFSHGQDYIHLEKRMKLAGSGLVSKALIISSVDTFFDNFWKR
ncbi:hypothetical protein HON36_03790 [Candidatus Parcubacteria bacterium]|jgi:hypothetical protein|nr:hypothetical protein [Candidatus Parcubacteria bacterium]MBT7228045.1 hypothetical protein [Candidatus Parcubacteria bacterium]